jgi:hypothetical protein
VIWDNKGNVEAAAIMALLSVGAVYALTEYGIAKGVPSPVSFVLVLAALFGLLVVKIKF